MKRKVNLLLIAGVSIIAGIAGGLITYSSTTDINDAIKYSMVATDDPYDCPFCGGKAEIRESDLFDNTAWVECEKCHNRSNQFNGVTIDDADEQALKAWNRRVVNSL